ncbi:hypothetical protein ACFWUP_20030 [Nocardia sp. NPDC058658]|uniref:hypothetical protein n=1 Tax=Nocardia sp. NPDC058658 TaxID=3346580 RepID=UPI0036541963
MLLAKPADQAAICHALSSPRAGTYIAASGGNLVKALALYGWNARVSAALMLPSHFAEVTTRNAVSEGLTAVYGVDWPWNATFTGSLPSKTGPAYNPQKDLVATRKRHATTGSVVTELKFAFWQSMFTSRHDVRVWDGQIIALFPNASGIAARQLRGQVYTDLDAVRKLRNRVAHHEPVFNRNLGEDLSRLLELIELRCGPTAAWVRSMEGVGALLTQRP